MIELTPEGERRIKEEIMEILDISEKYKPARFGGNPNVWEDYKQIENDRLHLAALLVSISPVVGQQASLEKKADYIREIRRDARYSELRSERNPNTNKKYTGDEAIRQARQDVEDYYYNHAHQIAEYRKINKLVYHTGELISVMNENLKRATIEGRRDAN